MPVLPCSLCQKNIYKKPKELRNSISGNIYCSRECFAKSLVINKDPCPVCDNPKPTNMHKYCSRACANKARYGIKYNVGQPQSKFAKLRYLKKKLVELRGPFCERCKYDVIDILVVHHKIERSKGGSNDIDNLELLCPNCHALHHYVDNKED